MAKVSINSQGCCVEVEDNKATARVLMNLAQKHWEKSRDNSFKTQAQAIGFGITERAPERSWLESGLEGDGQYRRHY